MESVEKKIVAAILRLIRSRRWRRALQQAPPASSLKTAPVKVRPACFSDFAAVRDLKSRCNLSHDSQENWQRLWLRNPALQELRGERPIGWVLEAGETVVGYLGNISSLYRYGDRQLTAVIASCLAVDPAYRAYTLGLVTAFYRQPNVDLYLTTTAIETVGQIVQALKSARMPQPDFDTYLFWVLKPLAFGEGAVKKLNFGPLLSRLGAISIACAVAIDKLLRRRLPKPRLNGLSVVETDLSQVGDEFHELWAQKLDERVCLLADRSPVVLRWYFDIPGDQGGVRVLACRREGELVGYAVVRNDPSHGGRRKSTLADLLVRNDDPVVTEALWRAAYDCAKRAGSPVLEVFGYPAPIRKVLLEWKPYQRTFPATPFYYKAADSVLHSELSDGTRWYATPFDGDATLIRPSFSAIAPAPITSAKDRLDHSSTQVSAKEAAVEAGVRSTAR